ncbi:hypothetical protein [Flavobacterium silvaticum]|uniref:Lipoprotein n=1 Tax=Flavobacterium silvaticum TaxID=1852020 RepID=A0A972FTJ2_9FLAO|nr:hypothetical protein [Flavobacterium silvaticum]NMH27305.1 hypothetical protein [Flavobacterium silvaticum]
MTHKLKLKVICCYLLVMILSGCGKKREQNSAIPSASTSIKAEKTETDRKKDIRYSDSQLEKFLDSVGGLPASDLIQKASFKADSTFKNQIQPQKTIAQSDFLKLKKAIQVKGTEKFLDLKSAKNIFGKIQDDSSYIVNGKIPITVFSFDKSTTDLNEYAICPTYPDAGWNCRIYFFKQNKIVAEHNIEHHYGLELEHYKDADGKTIIYYKQNFGTGTGIWQYNFYFYKYYDDQLIPILNVLENGNLQRPWGLRMYWLETFVKKTSPLTLKMVYYQELYDSIGNEARIIDDSTFVRYSWNENSKTLVGDYEKSDITEPQTVSYYLSDNELVFINSYHSTLKACLKDKSKRKLTLDYLNQVKNHYRKNSVK